MNKLCFLGLSALMLWGCKTQPVKHPKQLQTLTKITAKTIAIDSTTKEQQTITSIIAPYKQTVNKEINTVLSFAPKTLVRDDGDMQSTLGNLLADLCYEIGNPIFNTLTQKNIDFSMFNYGGIRAGINKGDVINKHAFELMPFENSLVVVELSGAKIKELVNYFITRKTAHPLSKQINLILKKDGYELNINHTPFNENNTYFVLTSDYLQSGGDRMTFFKDPISLTKLDYKMRDAIITYFKRVKRLESQLDNRVKKQ